MLIICQIDWREVGVAFELQCLRNCTLSSLKIVLISVMRLLYRVDNYSVSVDIVMYTLTEMIEFPVGLIAGVILSSVVMAMVAAKLVCVVSSRYRAHRTLTAGDTASDTDEQRDMLSSITDDPPRGQVDVGNDDASPPPGTCAQFGLLNNPLLHHHRLSFAVPRDFCI